MRNRKLGITFMLVGLGIVFVVICLVTSACASPSAAPVVIPTASTLIGPPAPEETPTEEPVKIEVHICVVRDFDEAPNNIAPIMNGDEKLGEITYFPDDNTFEHRDADGTLIQESTLPEKHAIVGVEIPGTNDVIVTELASCAGDLYYLQVKITKEQWEEIKRLSETDDA